MYHYFSTKLKEILEQNEDKLPTYENILKENKDKLLTYEEAMKFQQKINKSDFLKMK